MHVVSVTWSCWPRGTQALTEKKMVSERSWKKSACLNFSMSSVTWSFYRVSRQIDTISQRMYKMFLSILIIDANYLFSDGLDIVGRVMKHELFIHQKWGVRVLICGTPQKYHKQFRTLLDSLDSILKTEHFCCFFLALLVVVVLYFTGSNVPGRQFTIHAKRHSRFSSDIRYFLFTLIFNSNTVFFCTVCQKIMSVNCMGAIDSIDNECYS